MYLYEQYYCIVHPVLPCDFFPDCADQFTRTYGEFFTFNIPIQAEYLEFTPLHSEEEPTLLWNRTNPYDYKGGKLQMSSDIGGITSVTQSDNGFYDLRKKDNTLLSRKQLKVEGDDRNIAGVACLFDYIFI